jgi:hypothetical protein
MLSKVFSKLSESRDLFFKKKKEKERNMATKLMGRKENNKGWQNAMNLQVYFLYQLNFIIRFGRFLSLSDSNLLLRFYSENLYCLISS